MKNSWEYFLIAAEEKSISKAARRVFISQQAFSDQIKRLEAECNVTLFYRKPHLSLTNAGEIMARRLQQIKCIENIMKTELLEANEGIRGELSIGMHAARAKIIMPDLLVEYKKKYPHVLLTVLHDEADNLEKKFYDGDIDMFLGTNIKASPEIEKVYLMDAKIYLVISDWLLKQHFPEGKKFVNRISLQDFTHIPFIFSPGISRLYRTVQHFLDDNGLTLERTLTISDTDTQLLLAAKNCGACFCNKVMLKRIQQLNETQCENNPLQYFRIEGLNHADHIELIYNRNIYMPQYMKGFIELLQRQFQLYTDNQ